MKAFLERHMDPVKLAVFFIAVTLTSGNTTPSNFNLTDETTVSSSVITNTTRLQGALLNSSFQQNAFTNNTQLSPNASNASSNITTESVPGLQRNDSTNITSPQLFNDSTSTADNLTSIQGPLGPGGSINDTQPDPLGPLTTSTVTPGITSGQPPIAPQFTPPPSTGTNQGNPYSNLLPRPRPLSPLTQQQRQRVLNPWLFAGSDYFPYMFLLSQQQPVQQGPANSLPNGIAPLYFTGVDLDMWPWLLAQQRSPQQQLASQPQPLPQQPGRSQPQPLPQLPGRSQPQPLPQLPGRSQPQPLPQQPGTSQPQPLPQQPGRSQPLPQTPRQLFFNPNRLPQGQTPIPPQTQTRDNLANFYWLNEIYF